MVQPTIGRVLSDIEREIEAEVRNRTPLHEPRPVSYVPPRVSAPALQMPDYVEHRDGATEIGKLSAEAVVREYEAAAKESEASGAEVIERGRQCEPVTRDAHAVTEDVQQPAEPDRHEAKGGHAPNDN